MQALALSASLLFLLARTPAAQQWGGSSGDPATPGRILVSGFESDAVHRYRIHDGAPRRRATVRGAQSIVQGPDGLLYVASEEVHRVIRMNPQTLTVVDHFVRDLPGTPADENGPLNGPTAAVFGPGGDLFVASFDNDQILRYDGTTGDYLGVFVTPGLGGLNGPDAGTKFGPDGLLYVPSFFGDNVLRYDQDGAFVDEFIPFRSGGLRQPRDLVFHGGYWYVASSFNDRILRYAADGSFVDVFTLVARPYSLAFHPHDRNLYVVSLDSNSVFAFDRRSGDLLREVVAPGSGGLVGSVYLFFLP